MADNTVNSDHTAYGTLRVSNQPELPEVLDIFIAGGGPGGTAAAVRASELRLSCLVTDYDDVMKRIRDYPKEKQIKPNYGGGDKLQFPVGGARLNSLHFDDVDKDDMVMQWKAKYREYGLAVRIGAEFTGLSRGADGIWDVRVWSHRAGRELRYRARNVILAIGAGVPRRFDIPGNTEGLAFRLDDAANYVGAPALVIGGGTSAAEAVIAISNAKAANSELGTQADDTPVYWSYRGDKLPKVSNALSQVFFDAYIGNGNIRYLAFSEPVAIVPGPDKLDYLSLRIDRKPVPNRPTETVHLEFPTDRVVACIGEDLPIRLLQECGVKVPMFENRAMMLVNHEGQTSLPNVFLAGDARGPKYLRCTDFNDQSTYEKVTLKRNIKAAMVEAVEIVNLIATRGGASLAAAAVAAPVAASPLSNVPVIPPLPSEPVDARPRQAAVELVVLLPDGSVEETFPTSKPILSIGRRGADVSFPNDVHMADIHATIRHNGGAWILEDTGVGSGAWIRSQGMLGREVKEGDAIWAGSQILQVVRQDGGFAVAHYSQDGVLRSTYPIKEKGLFVGRSSEATLDAADLTLSRRHAQFRVENGVLGIYDLGSANGTYVKVRSPIALVDGDEFRIASKRLRFQFGDPVTRILSPELIIDAPPRPPLRPVVVEEPMAVPQPPRPEPAIAQPVPPSPADNVAQVLVKSEPAVAAPPSAVAPPVEGMAVSIEHAEFPVTFGASPSEDILHAHFKHLKSRFPDCKLTKAGEPSEHYDEPLGWDCKVGSCGLCAVEIVEGADNFVDAENSTLEKNTLDKSRSLEPDLRKHRLACLAKVKGPVKLRIPE